MSAAKVCLVETGKPGPWGEGACRGTFVRMLPCAVCCRFHDFLQYCPTLTVPQLCASTRLILQTFELPNHVAASKRIETL